MCRNVKTVSFCQSCETQLSESSSKQWCREAYRRGTFGRCSMGVRQAEEDYRGKECRSCIEARERAMDELDWDDLAKKRLGWTRAGDSDDDGGYGW
ncbi:hypothetical protein GGR51DRAFT_520943 [Nemania sp. FL0031]|nr:hypothetical protein GGR51DRAFT_520943 [Nemania sp. FL0031]